MTSFPRTLAIAVFSLGIFTITSTHASPAADEAKEIAWINLSKEGVKNRLKDPESAQFRKVFFSRKSGHPLTCGEVNSKNSLGGYVGYQRFIAGGDTLAFLEKEVDGFSKVWNEMCGQKS